MGCSDKQTETIIKVLAIMCALAMIALAIYKYVYYEDMTVLKGIWTFYWM